MSDVHPLRGRTLLSVFAHPDDESLACGGLLARCAALGATVALLCVTRGEGGPTDSAEGVSSEETPRHLGDTRAAELQWAAQVLGVSTLVILAHEDGMLPWGDAGRLEADIRDAIHRIRPDVVITFGPDGLYWHPDHIAVHEGTVAAVAALGDAAPALYYVTMPPGQMRAVVNHAAGTASYIVPGLDDPDAFGADAEAPTLTVEASEFAARKLAALLCHRSQMANSVFAGIMPSDASRLLGTEHFRRADIGARGRTFMDDLGDAVPGHEPPARF